MTDNHQEKNARALSDNGAAMLILEKDCTAQALMDAITSMLGDKEGQEKMTAALQRLCVPDSAERLCDVIAQLCKK